ncbi:MAG: DUF3389 family protein [Vibrio sp.]
MSLTFSQGRIIVSSREIQIRFDAMPQTRLQAQVDALKLLGGGVNLIIAHDMDCQWTLRLDNDEQLQQIADATGLAIE